MKAKELRKLYLDFFKRKKHTIVPSAPIIVKDDPTLMFTNAGMNQFKDIFLGYSDINNPRVANSQKCLRVSGKHNDLEQVGHDTYHHTMFEMLGSWSFGDYFKNEAITWAWEFLTETCKLDKERLYITVFEGSKEDGLDKDNESYLIWSKLVNPQNILNGSKKDNFWEMGDIGPCGPCSEIHYDNRDKEERKKYPGLDLVNKDHPQVIEIWNLVFIQYNRSSNGGLHLLPHQHVDTGMGFERLAMIMQGVKSNYDTDLFQPIISHMANQANIIYGEDTKHDIALRVISDHLRAIVFAIADGQLPSNVKAGYVVRRILRRAVRYGYTFLGFNKPFIYLLVPILTRQYSDQFPELFSQEKLIIRVIKKEEEMFLKTLKQGMDLLNKIIKNTEEKSVSGEKVFELYDTFGFPVDLTSLILRESGFVFNKNDFNLAMQKQKERSKNANKKEVGDWVILKNQKENHFVGYDSLEEDVIITRYRQVSVDGMEAYEAVFNQTPFYPEGGGQIGDVGNIVAHDMEIPVTKTQRENKLIIHTLESLPKDLEGSFSAIVNEEKRIASSRNHTATHLLHETLRFVLGDHVVQKGSLVNEKYLRFDFAHFSSITDKELLQIEKLVNKKILQNIPLTEQNLSLDQAKNTDVLMLFGEKYEDQVRMIQFNTSKELCGGTHVSSTGEVGVFKILSENSISSGTRRIEALTGLEVISYLNNQEKRLQEIELLVKTKDINQAVQQLIHNNKELDKKIASFKLDKKINMRKDLLESCVVLNDIRFIIKEVDLDSKDMKDVSFSFRNEDNLVVVLAARTSDKAVITLMLTNDLVDKGFHAGKLINKLACYIDGTGGGQPFFATAGGKNIAAIPDALEKAKDILV